VPIFPWGQYATLLRPSYYALPRLEIWLTEILGTRVQLQSHLFISMKIFLLSPFFFPEQISTGKYNTYLAEALVLAGHDVTIFASHPIYPNWRAEISNATLPGVEIIRGGGWIAYPRSMMLRRAILELWYAWFALTNYFRLGSRPGIVIPIFPPSLFFMLLHSLMPGTVCRVGIVHDLQGVYATRSSGIMSRILNGAIHFVEKFSNPCCAVRFCSIW
jgi:colanic acid biosynthesis glycosyl transferase WcaI